MHSHLRGSDGSVFFARRASVRCQGLQPLVRGDLSLPAFPPGRADERRIARRPCRGENEISGRPNQGLKSLASFVRPPDESHPCRHAQHGPAYTRFDSDVNGDGERGRLLLHAQGPLHGGRFGE
jgi:hypothetical protein